MSWEEKDGGVQEPFALERPPVGRQVAHRIRAAGASDVVERALLERGMVGGLEQPELHKWVVRDEAADEVATVRVPASPEEEPGVLGCAAGEHDERGLTWKDPPAAATTHRFDPLAVAVEAEARSRSTQEDRRGLRFRQAPARVVREDGGGPEREEGRP